MTNRSSDDFDNDHTDELPVLLESFVPSDDEGAFPPVQPDDTSEHTSIYPAPAQSTNATAELRVKLAERTDEIAILQSQIAALADRGPETAGAGCPFYEVLCNEQTQLYARMFRS